jgi:uncharacterized glyoxalase superfamily protein PhnB
MIHVPDVRATVDWYESIGFTLNQTYGNEESHSQGLSFAILSFGSTQVMFNQGGRPSSERRREVDLYVYCNDVDELHGRLKDRVEIVEGLHDTFYGMREFIIRDLNRFWITFGQPTAFDVLMTGIGEGKPELVQSALESGNLKPETLSAALVAASTGDKNAEIVRMLERAGALLPPEVNNNTLQSHVGKYQNEKGMEVDITLSDGKLFAAPDGQQSISLIAIDEHTFRPIIFDNVTVSFKESGKTVGFVFRQGGHATELKRVEN